MCDAVTSQFADLTSNMDFDMCYSSLDVLIVFTIQTLKHPCDWMNMDASEFYVYFVLVVGFSYWNLKKLQYFVSF